MQNIKLESIKAGLGESLLSILRYQRYQTIITVFIVDKVDFQILDSLRNEFKNEHFIIFKADDVLNGADVFPLDFLSIKNNHTLIEGKDYFSEIKIDKKNLQLKLEFELRNKLIYLREQYLLAPKKEEFLNQILPTFSLFIEGLLFLKDLTKTNEISEDIKTIEIAYVLNLNVIQRLIESGSTIQKHEINSIIQDLNDVLVELTQKVDKINL